MHLSSITVITPIWKHMNIPVDHINFKIAILVQFKLASVGSIFLAVVRLIIKEQTSHRSCQAAWANVICLYKQQLDFNQMVSAAD